MSSGLLSGKKSNENLSGACILESSHSLKLGKARVSERYLLSCLSTLDLAQSHLTLFCSAFSLTYGGPVPLQDLLSINILPSSN